LGRRSSMRFASANARPNVFGGSTSNPATGAAVDETPCDRFRQDRAETCKRVQNKLNDCLAIMLIGVKAATGVGPASGIRTRHSISAKEQVGAHVDCLLVRNRKRADRLARNSA
jgi:hypothetical protein